MKIILIVCLFISCALNGSEIFADYIDGEKSSACITPEIHTAVSLLIGKQASVAFMNAIQLNMVKYDMDMKTESGRKAWHGTLIGEEIHTNELVKVEIYSNEVSGAIWRYKLPFQQKSLILKKFAMPEVNTNGIPPALARARIKRLKEKNSVSNITINVEANSTLK